MGRSELLLQKASNEIKQLRAQNHEMNLRLGMFDSIMMLLTSSTHLHGSRPAAPDICFEIQKHLDTLKQYQQVEP